MYLSFGFSSVAWFLCPTLRCFYMAADFPITVCRNKTVAQSDYFSANPNHSIVEHNI